jgi:hypothetical protein
MPDVTDRSWFANTATFERFQPFGRVRASAAPRRECCRWWAVTPRPGSLVRSDAQPPDWSEQEGPSEFAHWLLHTEQSMPGWYGRPSLPWPFRLACQ